VTIRNLYRFTNALWDWGVLNDCFDHGCRVSDIDGQVERRSEFLILEAKGPGVSISSGLARTLNRYLELGHHTPVILYGESGHYRQCCLYCGNPTTFEKDPPAPTQLQIWPHDAIPCDLRTVQEFVRAWFTFADDQPTPLISSARPRSIPQTAAALWAQRWLEKKIR
jgi:hypothetical protein